MNPELYDLIRKAVEEGITSVSWTVIFLGLFGAGLGAFLGSYLMKRGELRAIQENVDEALRQLREQTEATERIKG